jgi:hypothetical protein
MQRTLITIVPILAVFASGLSGCNDTTAIVCEPPAMLSADGTKCTVTIPDASVTMCGAGTQMVGNSCVVAAGACGTNLTLMNGQCIATSAICQSTGTVFDPATFTCKRPSDGTMLSTVNFTHAFQHIFYANTVTNVDAGTTSTIYSVVGNSTTQIANIPDTTQLFNRAGRPLGGLIAPVLNVPPYADVTWPTALDITRTVTLADWKACGGSVSFYKPPAKINGKAVYKIVADVAGCLPQTLYTTWMFYTPDGTRANAFMVSSVGGMPSELVTDDAGAGHWERYVDSDVWFKAGANMPYAQTHMPPPTIPDPSALPNAGIIFVVAYHSTAQNNGNVGFCVKDPNNTTCNGLPCCMTPPSPGIAPNLPGTDGHHQLTYEPATKLSLLQPY